MVPETGNRNKLAFLGLIVLVGASIIVAVLVSGGGKKSESKAKVQPKPAAAYPTPSVEAPLIGAYVNGVLEARGSQTRITQLACSNIDQAGTKVVADGTTPFYGCLMISKQGAAEQCNVANFSVGASGEIKLESGPQQIEPRYCSGA